jgi:hypothetical protein
MDSNELIERTTEEGYQNAIIRGEKRKLEDDAETNEKTENDETSKKLKEETE